MHSMTHHASVQFVYSLRMAHFLPVSLVILVLNVLYCWSAEYSEFLHLDDDQPYDRIIQNNSAINITVQFNKYDLKKPFVFYVPDYRPITEFDKIVKQADNRSYEVEESKNSVKVTIFNISEPFPETEFYFIHKDYANKSIDLINQAQSILLNFTIKAIRHVRFNDERVVKDRKWTSDFEIPHYIKFDEDEGEMDLKCQYRGCRERFYETECDIGKVLTSHFQIVSAFLNQTNENWKISTNFTPMYNGMLFCSFLDHNKGKVIFKRLIRAYNDEVYDVLRIPELNLKKKFHYKEPPYFISLVEIKDRLTCHATFHSGFSKVKWMPITLRNVTMQEYEISWDDKNDYENQTILKLHNLRRQQHYCRMGYSDLKYEEWIDRSGKKLSWNASKEDIYFACIAISHSEFAFQLVKIEASFKCSAIDTILERKSFVREDVFEREVPVNSESETSFDCDYEGFPKLTESWMKFIHSKGELRVTTKHT